MSKKISLALALICSLFIFGLFSACRHDEKMENYETVPVLEDTRGTQEKMNTFRTLNGDEVTYNMNTRRIIALSGAGDLVAFGLRPLAVSGNTTTAGYESFF